MPVLPGGTGNALPASPLVGTDQESAGMTGQSNTGPGVLGQSLGLAPTVQSDGLKTSGAPGSDGVRGEGWNGVHGITGNGSGHANPQPAGVWGESDTTNGVYGSSTGWNGVEGESWSAAHAGVAGQNDAGGPGVWGSSTGNAGQFEGNVLVTGIHTAQQIVCIGATSIGGNIKITKALRPLPAGRGLIPILVALQ
jgi:hypothetical protein